MTTRDSRSYYSINRKKSDLFTSWIAKQFGQIYTVSRKPDQTTKTKGIFWWVQKTSRGTFKRKMTALWRIASNTSERLAAMFPTSDYRSTPESTDKKYSMIGWAASDYYKRNYRETTMFGMFTEYPTYVRKSSVTFFCRVTRSIQFFCNKLLSHYSTYGILL
jgi:hypothetical protein